MPFFLLAPLTWLGNLLFSAIVWFVSRRGIAITIGITLIGLVGVAINQLVQLVDSNLGQVFSSAIPFATPFITSNTGLCISLIVATEIACTGYKLAIKLIDWKSRILLA